MTIRVRPTTTAADDLIILVDQSGFGTDETAIGPEALHLPCHRDE
jgi:hypothetical protein